MRKLLLASVMLLACGCTAVDHTWDAKDAPNEAEAQKICKKHGKLAQRRALAEDHGAHFRAYFGYLCVAPGDPGYTAPDKQ